MLTSMSPTRKRVLPAKYRLSIEEIPDIIIMHIYYLDWPVKAIVTDIAHAQSVRTD